MAQEIELSREVEEKRVRCALSTYIPILLSALRQYNVIASKEQASAENMCSEMQKRLERHVDLFGGSAPHNTRMLETRIQELQQVSLTTKSEMLEIAHSQMAPWGRTSEFLSVEVADMVFRQYDELSQTLSEPVAEVRYSTWIMQTW